MFVCGEGDIFHPSGHVKDHDLHLGRRDSPNPLLSILGLQSIIVRQRLKTRFTDHMLLSCFESPSLQSGKYIKPSCQTFGLSEYAEKMAHQCRESAP